MKVFIVTPHDAPQELFSCLQREQIDIHFFHEIDVFKQYHFHPNDPIIINLSSGRFSLDDVKAIRVHARESEIFCIDDKISRERVNELYTLGIFDLIAEEYVSALLPAKIFDCCKKQLLSEQLSNEFQNTQKVAMSAMTASSEYGEVINFVEQSYGIVNYEELAELLFHTTNALGLCCTLYMEINNENICFCSSGEVNPNEWKLLNCAKDDKRFHDFGMRMIINFPNVSLLVKNMPVEDNERFGHIKDLLPVLMSVLNAKLNALQVGGIVQTQAGELASTFEVANKSFSQLSAKIKRSNDTMSRILNDLSLNLPGMALDEDQEAYIIERVERLMDDSVELLLSEKELSSTFATIQSKLVSVIEKQDAMEKILQKDEALHQNCGIRNSIEDARVELF